MGPASLRRTALSAHTRASIYGNSTGCIIHLAVDGVVALGGELGGVHLGRGRHPETGRQLAIVLVEELASRAEVADVGHAAADEDLFFKRDVFVRVCEKGGRARTSSRTRKIEERSQRSDALFEQKKSRSLTLRENATCDWCN